MKFKLIFFFLLFSIATQAQYITGIGTKWSDEFIEWNIYTEDDEIAGEITMRWQMQLDWSEWDYTIGDESGSIKMKWKNNPNQWEVSGENELITMRTLFKDDPSEWRITNDSETITLKSRWRNNFNEWQLKHGKYGEFNIISQWEGDPREWIIEDDLDDEISANMKVAIMFIVTYHSSPKG